MKDDLFGSTDNLDVSDEALEERWEEDTSHEVAEPEAPTEDPAQEPAAEAETPAEEPAGAEVPAGQPEAEKPAEEPEPVQAAVPDKYAGKSAEEIARLAAESESYFGRKLQEMQQQIAHQQALMQQQMQQPAPDADDLLDPGYNDAPNPVAAYNQALELLDSGTIGLDVVEEVIERTYDLDARLARRMERDLDRRISRVETMQAVQPVQQSAYQQEVLRATHEMYNTPDGEAYAQDVVQMLKGKHLGNTPEEIRASLNDALIRARGQDPTRSQAYKTALQALKQDTVVEQGNATSPPTQMTEADLIRQQLFQRKDPADLLFQ